MRRRSVRSIRAYVAHIDVTNQSIRADDSDSRKHAEFPYGRETGMCWYVGSVSVKVLGITSAADPAVVLMTTVTRNNEHTTRGKCSSIRFQRIGENMRHHNGAATREGSVTMAPEFAILKVRRNMRAFRGECHLPVTGETAAR